MDFNKIYESVQEKHFDNWYDNYNTEKLKEEVIQNASEVTAFPHERMSKALRCLESFVSDEDWLELRETIIDLENLERKIFHQGFSYALKEDQSKILESYARIGTFDNKIHLRESYNDIETYNNYKRIKELDRERKSGKTGDLIESLNDYYLKEEIRDMIKEIDHLYEAANQDFADDWNNSTSAFKTKIEGYIVNGDTSSLDNERNKIKNKISGILPPSTKFHIENDKIYYYKEDPTSGIIPDNSIINSKNNNFGMFNYVWYKTYDMDDNDIPDTAELDNEFNSNIKSHISGIASSPTPPPQPPTPTLNFTSEKNFKINKEVRSIPLTELVSKYTPEVIQASLKDNIEKEKQDKKDDFTKKNAGDITRTPKAFNKAQKKEDKRLEQEALKRLTDIEAYGIRRKILEYVRSKFNDPSITPEIKRTVMEELQYLEKSTSKFARTKAKVMNFIKRRAPLLMNIITFASGAISIGMKFTTITAMFGTLGPLAPVMGLLVSTALFFIQRAIFRLAGKVTDAIIEKLFTSFIDKHAKGKGPLAWICKKITMDGGRAKLVTKVIVKILTTIIIAKPTSDMLTGLVGKLSSPMISGLNAIGITAETASNVIPPNLGGTLQQVTDFAEGKIQAPTDPIVDGSDNAIEGGPGRGIHHYGLDRPNVNMTPEEARHAMEELSKSPTMIEKFNQMFADKLNNSPFSAPQSVEEILSENPNQAEQLKALFDRHDVIIKATDSQGDVWTFVRQIDGQYRAFEQVGANVAGPGQVFSAAETLGSSDVSGALGDAASSGDATAGQVAELINAVPKTINDQIATIIDDLKDGIIDGNNRGNYAEWISKMTPDQQQSIFEGLKNVLAQKGVPGDQLTTEVANLLNKAGLNNITNSFGPITTQQLKLVSDELMDLKDDTGGQIAQLFNRMDPSQQQTVLDRIKFNPTINGDMNRLTNMLAMNGMIVK